MSIFEFHRTQSVAYSVFISIDLSFSAFGLYFLFSLFIRKSEIDFAEQIIFIAFFFIVSFVIELTNLRIILYFLYSISYQLVMSTSTNSKNSKIPYVLRKNICSCNLFSANQQFFNRLLLIIIFATTTIQTQEKNWNT